MFHHPPVNIQDRLTCLSDQLFVHSAERMPVTHSVTHSHSLTAIHPDSFNLPTSTQLLGTVSHSLAFDRTATQKQTSQRRTKNEELRIKMPPPFLPWIISFHCTMHVILTYIASSVVPFLIYAPFHGLDSFLSTMLQPKRYTR